MGKETGFGDKTADKLLNTALEAELKDTGQRNVEIENGVGTHFKVSEESRRNPFANSSLQSVGGSLYTNTSPTKNSPWPGEDHRAYLESKEGGHIYQLIGKSTGQVVLTIDGKPHDITEVAAAAGMTAAGIARTVNDIAADGEVTRKDNKNNSPEQERIMNEIKKARGMAEGR